MAMNIIREDLETTAVVCRDGRRCTAEADTVIPDSKPDIRKVLEVSGYTHITDTAFREGKLRIEGKAQITLLYLSDGEEGRIQTLSAEAPFFQTFDCSPEEGAQITAESEPESFDASVLNSRKVNLRCSVGIQVKVTAPRHLSPVVNVEGEEGISLRTEQLHLLKSTSAASCQWIMREQAELPAGKPAIGEVLRVSAEPTVDELCMLEEKAQIKGDVRLCVLYTAQDKEQSLQYMEHSIPFTEILEVPGSDESMEGEADCNIQDIYWELREDSDGEARILSLELLLCATIRGTETIEPCVVTHACARDSALSLTSVTCAPEQLLDKRTAELSLRDDAQIPSGMPSLTQVCNVTATAKTENVTREGDEICVYGKVTSRILYLSADAENPVSCFRHITEFSHRFPAPDTAGEIACDARVCVSHCGYTLSGDGAVTLQFVLGLTVKTLFAGEIAMVENIEATDEPLPELPCLALYFVQAGDTLWDIAKRYRTTMDTIRLANDLQSDILPPGKQLKIQCNR